MYSVPLAARHVGQKVVVSLRVDGLAAAYDDLWWVKVVQLRAQRGCFRGGARGAEEGTKLLSQLDRALMVPVENSRDDPRQLGRLRQRSAQQIGLDSFECLDDGRYPAIQRRAL